MLIACTDDFRVNLELSTTVARFSVTGNIVHRADNTSWAITGVYGPQEDNLKVQFMQELRWIKPLVQEKWMILGDFNLICRTEEKNNPNINLRLMGLFRA